MRFSQLRIARPTNQIEAIKHFYCELLSLPLIASFNLHEGYDGIMIGLPGADCHLEFTQQEKVIPLPVPTAEHLLVFYFDDREELKRTLSKLKAEGMMELQPENPYWSGKSFTFSDPDGWRMHDRRSSKKPPIRNRGRFSLVG